VLAQTDLAVYLNDTLLTLTTDYTVTLNGSGSGTVTLVVAATGSDTVTIASDRPIARTADYVTGGDLLADTLNAELDSQIIFLQQLEENYDRLLNVGASDTAPSMTLPSAEYRASKYMAFDANGSPVVTNGTANAFVVSTFAETLLDDADAAAMRTTIGAQASDAELTAIAGLASAANKVPMFSGSGTATLLDFKDEDTMASDSATAVPSQQSVKSYVDAQQIKTISASVGSNALTISVGSLSLAFRSASIGSGVITTVTGDPTDLVISSGSTLGTVDAIQSRLAVLALNNAGALELAVVNMAGGVDLSETGVISTTAEGGAGAADSASVVYSTTARSNLAYRVIGYIESTQPTAGTWATAPSTIQGAVGQASTAMSSLGFGQTWQNVLASRASGTTYYNTTGKPIVVNVGAASPGGAVVGIGIAAAVAGVTVWASGTNGTFAYPALSFIVPPGQSYSVSISGVAFSYWSELR
jgi:hypothetical protein